ncbi:hypothetical protein [Megamonas hypermegale]|uniref:hypothetical protein n=1 Tax=Megamonas hypermegale TaxID=158847 RepID=UPI0026EA66A3|nr:hypothetical protein [Megamonas hypermegale]
MSDWKKISINKQNVRHETAKAALIAMPHKSNYDGYEFWVSSKLVHPGSHSYELYLSLKDDYTFKLRKTGKGKYNRYEVIDEQTISAEEMIEAFDGEVDQKAQEDDSYVLVEEPEYRKPTESQVDEELSL